MERASRYNVQPGDQVHDERTGNLGKVLSVTLLPGGLLIVTVGFFTGGRQTDTVTEVFSL